MLLVADIHGAADALARVADSSEPLLVLGDLVNLIDYRTSAGIVADVVGVDLIRRISHLRANRRRAEANDLWRVATEGRTEEVNAAIGDLMAEEYRSVCLAMEGT
ncbi:MAG: metallophosphoesterase, partial [Actinobacteria bacterium]